jgi:YqjK-like protein
MSERARQLAARRELLVMRSERLRSELRDSTRGLGRGWRTVDRGFAFARSRLLWPAVVAGGLLIVLVRPSRVLKLAGRALILWPVVRPLVPIVWSLVGAAKGARRPDPGPTSR